MSGRNSRRNNNNNNNAYNSGRCGWVATRNLEREDKTCDSFNVAAR